MHRMPLECHSKLSHGSPSDTHVPACGDRRDTSDAWTFSQKAITLGWSMSLAGSLASHIEPEALKAVRKCLARVAFSYKQKGVSYTRERRDSTSASPVSLERDERSDVPCLGWQPIFAVESQPQSCFSRTIARFCLSGTGSDC